MFGHDDNSNQPTDDNMQVNDPQTPVQDHPEELTLPTPMQSDDSGSLGFDPNGSDMPAETLPTQPEVQMAAPVEAVAPEQQVTITPSGTLNNLNELKMEALRELSPLIGHLNQTPDEKYETAKMIYEETKDQSMLSAVYEAAKNLTDEKAKAEAIYDVVKKINQF